MSRRLFFVVAAIALLVAAGGRWRAGTLPAPYAPTGALPHSSVREVRVAYHVHTTRSDGTGTPDAIADAALKAGLDAVILTDHGDGTRVPDAPRRVHGVLLIDAVEISTWGGHYVALGAQPSPYPLGGEPAAVVEDVARLGGVGIAAHPGSAKADLKWRAWDAPFDGLEWLNADSEWRDRPRALWSAVPAYPWAPERVIASLLDRPVFELEAWDQRAAIRPAVGLAAHDAHARIGLGGVGEPYDGAVALEAPGYGAMFRTFANVVRVPDDWGRDDVRDGAALVDAIRGGRTYAVVTGLGGSWVTTFRATSGSASAGMGQSLVPEGPVAFEAQVEAPPEAVSALVCDGRVVTRTRGGQLSWTSATAPGACRLEVTLTDAPAAMPWLVTNPIYARAEVTRAVPPEVLPPTSTSPIAASGDAGAWTVEAAAGASATVDADPAQPRRAVMRWTLGPDASTYAAIRLPTPPDVAQFDRVILSAAANRPLRMWVQVRAPAGGGQRWGRSVFLDTTPRTITLPLSSFLPLDGQGRQQVPVDAVTALLFVADTVHARPGDTAVVTFDEWALAR